jgi:twitching motility protein PilT
MRLHDLLREVAALGGSDLHLLDGLAPRIRVRGELTSSGGAPVDALALVGPILDPLRRARFDAEGEVDLAYEAEGAGRFRVNVFRHHRGAGAVFRLIPARIPTLEELRLPAAAARFASFGSGLVLVTGPTGSGKSSTLAAILDLVNGGTPRHVVTIEDPIEYVHEDRACSFTQREVGSDTESFEAALRSAMRQDADLVLVGEMRDYETIRLALSLAEMGMLVFSTLHTTSASRTVDRIVEVFPEEQQAQARAMLAESLQGILAQLLLPTRDGKGRIPATELLFTSTALRSVVREGAAHKIESMLKAGRAEGMHLMDDSLYALAEERAVSGEDAYRLANDKPRFRRFVE